MGDHHDGGALLVQLGEQLHYLQTILGVKVTRRLIGQDQLGVHHDGTGNGDALLLTARELLRKVVCAVADGHPAQHFFNTLLTLLLGYAKVGQRQLHVLLHVQFVDEVETLEHKSYLSFANLRALTLLQLTHFLTIEVIGATGGIVEP